MTTSARGGYQVARGARSRVPWPHWLGRTPWRPGQERRKQAGRWEEGERPAGLQGLPQPAGRLHPPGPPSLEATLPPPLPEPCSPQLADVKHTCFD